MSDLLSWYASHPDLFSGRRWAPVGTVISIRSRDLSGRDLIPKHLASLLGAGVPAMAIRDEHLSLKALKRFRIVTLETATCLEESAAQALAAWVRTGGRLIAARDAGEFDELGRKRSQSALWQALGLDACPEKEVAVGRGRVLAADPGTFAGVVTDWTEDDSFHFTPQANIEVVAYRAPDRLLLHLVRHDPISGPVLLRLPSTMRYRAAAARLYAPGLKEVQSLTLTPDGDSVTITLPEVPVYSVIVIDQGSR